jgi:hypothetical protein
MNPHHNPDGYEELDALREQIVTVVEFIGLIAMGVVFLGWWIGTPA